MLLHNVTSATVAREEAEASRSRIARNSAERHLNGILEREEEERERCRGYYLTYNHKKDEQLPFSLILQDLDLHLCLLQCTLEDPFVTTFTRTPRLWLQ